MVIDCEKGTAVCKSSEYGNISIQWHCYEPKTIPIILLHAMLSTKDTWTSIAEDLAKLAKTKVYMYDARNHGDGEYLEEFDFDVLVKDLFNFMNRMAIEKAILIGHEMGAQTAFRAAFQKPDRVETVISEDTYVRKLSREYYDGCLTFVQRLALHAREVYELQISPCEAAKELFKILASRYPDDVNYRREKENLLNSNFSLKLKDNVWQVNFNAVVLMNLLRNSDYSISQAEGRFVGSVLFICGENSSYRVFSETQDINEHFPNAEIVTLENSGHYPHTDKPAEYVENIVKFLKGRGHAIHV